MSNTITKTSLRGFTLIELLVVIAIIGLLSTAIMGPVQTGLKKGRDTRKISDITQIQGALLQYAGDNNGEYPLWLAFDVSRMENDDITVGFASSSLASSSPTYMMEDEKMFRISTKIGARDRYGYVVYADPAGNVVGYHLGVSLENQNASLQGDADCHTPGNSATSVTGGMVGNTWGSIDKTAELSFSMIDPIGTPKSCTSLDSGEIFNSNVFILGGGEIGRNDGTTEPSNFTGSDDRFSDFNGEGIKEKANDVCTNKLDTCIFDITPN